VEVRKYNPLKNVWREPVDVARYWALLQERAPALSLWSALQETTPLNFTVPLMTREPEERIDEVAKSVEPETGAFDVELRRPRPSCRSRRCQEDSCCRP